MNKNGENSPKKSKWRVWIISCGVAAIVLPGIVCWIMQRPWKPISWMTGDIWLDFWGSYLGGLLGAMAALIALYMSQKQAEELRAEAKENQRLSVMPALSVTHKKMSVDDVKNLLSKYPAHYALFPSHIGVFYETTPNEFFRLCKENGFQAREIAFEASSIEITNCGMGPAFNIRLSYNGGVANIAGIKDGESFSALFLCIFMESDDQRSAFTMDIRFSDILGNKYEQNYEITAVTNTDFHYSATDAPRPITDC